MKTSIFTSFRHVDTLRILEAVCHPDSGDGVTDFSVRFSDDEKTFTIVSDRRCIGAKFTVSGNQSWNIGSRTVDALEVFTVALSPDCTSYVTQGTLFELENIDVQTVAKILRGNLFGVKKAKD